jgi:hypothetical protein
MRGPWFGNSDLNVNKQRFNDKNSCRSAIHKDGYNIPSDENGVNMLTGLTEEWFSLEEMEVFTIEKIKVPLLKNPVYQAYLNGTRHPLTLSKCMINDFECIFIQNLLPMNFSNTFECIYRGSDNGWMFADFHSNCDN